MKNLKAVRNYIRKMSCKNKVVSDNLVRKTGEMITELFLFFERMYKTKYGKEIKNPLLSDKGYQMIKRMVWNGIKDCKKEFMRYCNYLLGEDRSVMFSMCQDDMISFCKGGDVFDAWRRHNMGFYKDFLIFLINQSDNVVKLQYKQYDVSFENAIEDNLEMLLNTF